MDTDSDDALLASAAAGDQDALERLLLRHYNRLAHRIARKIPPELRGFLGEDDILQQTMIAAFRGIGSFQPQGQRAFYRWLVTIAQHALQDAVKAQRAIKRGGGRDRATGATGVNADSMDELIDLIAGPDHTSSRSVAHHEATAAIHVALASVKEDYRRAITLRYLQGQPVAETAKAMGRTPHAVHHLCYRGLQELRVVMGRSSQYLSRD